MSTSQSSGGIFAGLCTCSFAYPIALLRQGVLGKPLGKKDTLVVQQPSHFCLCSSGFNHRIIRIHLDRAEPKKRLHLLLLPLTCASLRNWLRLIMHMSKLSEASINRSKTSGFLDMFWRELRMPNGSRYCVFMITCINTRSTLCLNILHLWVQQFCDLHFFLIVP